MAGDPRGAPWLQVVGGSVGSPSLWTQKEVCFWDLAGSERAVLCVCVWGVGWREAGPWDPWDPWLSLQAEQGHFAQHSRSSTYCRPRWCAPQLQPPARHLEPHPAAH